MSQPKSSKRKPFKYENEEDYIMRQVSRARLLMVSFILILGVAAVVYLFFHVEKAEGEEGVSALDWRSVSPKAEWPTKALDWMLWSLSGTLIYLLFEIGHYYQTIGEKAQKGSWPPSYIEYTPWYLITLIKGPAIAVVILFFFNSASLTLTGTSGTEGTGFNFNFSQLDHSVTLLLAFVLGFYSRVARHVLDGIVKTLFSKAWAEAHEEFEIEPSYAKIVLGGTMIFGTTEIADVVWAASLGTIDATGKYIAPEEPEHCNKTVVITAVSTGTTSIARSAKVTLVPFTISGPAEIELSSEPKYSAYNVSPAAEDITWTVSPDEGGGEIDENGKYTSPKKEEAKTEKITITATITRKDAAGTEWKCHDSVEVILKSREENQ